MTKIISMMMAVFLLSIQPTFAGDPMGLDLLPFENSVIPIANIQKQYDSRNAERLVGVTASTAAAPNVIVNYYHSLLLAKGWKSDGTVSAQGAHMLRDDEEIFINTGTGTGQYHTFFTIRLSTIAPQAEGAR